MASLPATAGERQEAVVVERFRIVEAARRKGVSEAPRMLECSRTTVYKLMRR